MYGSFGNLDRKDFKGDKYFDEKDRTPKDSELYGIAGDDFDTEEFETFKQLHDKYGDKQNWFGPNDGENFFNYYKKTTGKPFKVKTRKDEMGEGFGYEDVNDENPDDIEDELPNYRKPRHRHQSVSDDHSSRMEEMIEGLFSESKVDSILEKYFKINEKEKQILESKIQQSTSLKEVRKEKISNIKKLSESISQEVASTKVINKYPEAKLIGKTNKNNLVFEMNNKQLRVNTKGQIL